MRMRPTASTALTTAQARIEDGYARLAQPSDGEHPLAVVLDAVAALHYDLKAIALVVDDLVQTYVAVHQDP